MSESRVNDRWVQTHGDWRLAIGERYLPALPQPSRPWYRLPICIAKLCGGRVESDDAGLWFQCSTCERVSGFVSAEELRRQADSAFTDPSAS